MVCTVRPFLKFYNSENPSIPKIWELSAAQNPVLNFKNHISDIPNRPNGFFAESKFVRFGIFGIADLRDLIPKPRSE
jgi:hypothetical protein